MISVLVTVALLILAGLLAVNFFRGAGGSGTETTSQGGTSQIILSFGQTPRLLGPGTSMNYTLRLTPGSGAVGTAMLSSDQPQGLSVTFNPSAVTLSGTDVAVDVSVKAANSVSPGDYGVVIRVVWPSGSSNLTYHFTVVRHLILLLGGSTGPGGFDPQNLSSHVGETITWLSLDAGSDEYGGLRSVKIIETNATSPTLSLFSTWSYAFSQAGTYHTEDYLNSILVQGGTIVVG